MLRVIHAYDIKSGVDERSFVEKKVLDFVRALARKTPKGTPGKALLRHMGSIPAEEVDRMSQAIEEGCEQINPDAW